MGTFERWVGEAKPQKFYTWFQKGTELRFIIPFILENDIEKSYYSGWRTTSNSKFASFGWFDSSEYPGIPEENTEKLKRLYPQMIIDIFTESVFKSLKEVK